MNNIPKCKVCGQEFDDIFEAVDHLMDDDDEGSEFNPVLTLPNGYSFMIGSMLRKFFDEADNPEDTRRTAEMVYGTLYAATTDAGYMRTLIEDAIVFEQSRDIDNELKNLLDEEGNE